MATRNMEKPRSKRQTSRGGKKQTRASSSTQRSRRTRASTRLAAPVRALARRVNGPALRKARKIWMKSAPGPKRVAANLPLSWQRAPAKRMPRAFSVSISLVIRAPEVSKKFPGTNRTRNSRRTI